MVGFQADTVRGRRTAFLEAVEDYVETCAKAGEAVEEPASGKLMLRVAPEVHRAALIAAKGSATSLNQWAAKVLSKAAHV